MSLLRKKYVKFVNILKHFVVANKESFGSLSLGIRTGAVLCENEGLSKLENTVSENTCID